MGFGRSISLVGAGRVFVIGAVVYAAVAAVFSFSFLREIETDARYTREHQIPKILSQNVNAVKVEKLSSLVRSAYLARDARLERQIQVETRALAQSFSLDKDDILVRGAKRIADDVKAIVALRSEERAASIARNKEDAALKSAYDDAMRTARGLTDHLTTDAALVADTMSNKIEDNVRSVRTAWMLILAVPALGALAFFWTFRLHVARPINATIDRLAAIGSQQFDDSRQAEPLFCELRMIAAAVETYGQLSGELRKTNAVLQALSHQDALTGVGNRRSFDSRLDAEFRSAVADGGSLTVLLIDLDHFKRINDDHGHASGDACLKAVGNLLGHRCGMAGYHVARYGGEEFAVLMPNTDTASGSSFAEELRGAISVEAVPLPAGGETFRMTASIGIAGLDGVRFETAAQFIGAADVALYEAKRSGRNRVCRYPSSNEARASASQAA